MTAALQKICFVVVRPGKSIQGYIWLRGYDLAGTTDLEICTTRIRSPGHTTAKHSFCKTYLESLADLHWQMPGAHPPKGPDSFILTYKIFET